MLADTELRVANYPPFLAMAPHCHDTVSMNIVLGGEFFERIGRGESRYARGHAALVPPGIMHSQQFGATGARQIIFRPEDSWLDYLSEGKTGFLSAPHHAAPEFPVLGDRLLSEMQNDDAVSPLVQEALLLEFVAAFGRTGTGHPSSRRIPTWLRAARDFLHQNAGERLTLKTIAHAAGRHEIHLAREFRRHFGTTIGSYLRRIRIEKAARRLIEGRDSLSAVALDCGFSSQSHMCREFRARYGVTPSAYRSTCSKK